MRGMTTWFSIRATTRSSRLPLAILIMLGAAIAEAQTWTGGGGNNLWSNNANWSSPPGTSPGTLVFAGTTGTLSFNDNAVTSVGTLRIIGGTAGSGGFVLSGSGISVSTLIETTNPVTEGGNNVTEEIALPITLGGATVSVDTGGNGHWLRISGVISGGAGNSLQKNSDNGRLFLTADNTFIGQAAFRQGSVQFPKWGNISDPAPLGAGNLPVQVGQAAVTVEMIYDGVGETTNRYIQVGMGNNGTGGATITNNGTGPIVFTAAARPSHPTYGNDLFNQRHTTATVNRTLTFQGSNTGSNTVASIIVDNVAGTARVGVTKSGTGRWILSGTNTYTGGTQVNAGTLVLDGLTGVSAFTNNVASGAILAGSGTLSGATTVSGILSPGAGVGSIGTLSFASPTGFIWNGGASASAATDWLFDLSAAGASDRVSITGPFNKAGSVFRFDFGGSAEIGTYTLASWTTTTQFSATDFTYTNLGGGNTGTFTIDGSTLKFEAVPEPSTMAGVAAGGAAALAWRMRRRRL